MAIPSETLRLTIDVDNLTLDELEIFERQGFRVKAFKEFMARWSSWTEAQIGALTVAEMRDVVMPRIAQAIQEAAVPKASSPP